jgi:hypothetical protein
VPKPHYTYNYAARAIVAKGNQGPIPVYVQRPCQPNTHTLVGEAPESWTALQVAAHVGVPDGCLIEGKIVGRSARAKHGKRWFLVADVFVRHGEALRSITRREYWPTNAPTPSKLSRADLERWLGEGLTYSGIGVRVGLTRARVQQIAEREGLLADTSHTRVHERYARMAELVKRGIPPAEAGCIAGVAPTSRGMIAAKAGLQAIKQANVLARMAPLIERVRNGESIHRVAGGNRTLATRLRRYCEQLGVKSAHPSNNPRYRRDLQ